MAEKAKYLVIEELNAGMLIHWKLKECKEKKIALCSDEK